ncbi:hypothetical protein P7C70_g2589, partial [Phenoliferia sp. Uapishka_3]
MITIERKLLSTDLSYRVAFNRDFLEFTDDDAKVLHYSAPLILPVRVSRAAPGAEYERWQAFTIISSSGVTRKRKAEVFLKRNVGFEGDLAESLEALTVDDPQMKMRKQFLSYWCAKILTADFNDPKFWEYLDKVGIMHTGMPGFKHRANKEPLKVDLQALSLTLGWVVDVVLTIVLGFPKSVLSTGQKTAVCRAFNKIIWIQQDLFARHYTRTDEEAEANLKKNMEAAEDEAKSEEEYKLERTKKHKELEEIEEARKAMEATSLLPDVKV